MRILTEIDDQDVAKLDEMAAHSKRSRAALIRDAVAAFLRGREKRAADDAFGLWGKRKVDGLAYQRKVRAEW